MQSLSAGHDARFDEPPDPHLSNDFALNPLDRALGLLEPEYLPHRMHVVVLLLVYESSRRE